MSSVQERLQLKRVPLDTWNIREQLCLASAVVRSGDQNWMSVSRALKTVGEANRPPDWYSQKSCAAQYGALLEHVETPKRKKLNSEGAVETPQESILKKLTQERIVEIQKTVAELNQHYEQLKNDVTEARNPATSDDRLREMWAEIETAKRTRERETARRAAWLKEREERRAKAERTWRPPSAHSGSSAVPAPPSSPLLTSLLKSSPVVTTPQHISHPANCVETVSPSAGAPTLSMLLEKPGAGTTGVPAAGAASPHDNKHAAIEHIKSQLVQIEQQLKASATPPPAAAPLPPAALDIDDIEIKAEDVYAFRDVDIHIPPVTHLHKPIRTEIATPKIVEQETPQMATTDTAPPQLVQEIKEEPIASETVSEDLAPVDVETVEPASTPAPGVDTSADPHAGAGSPAGAVEMRFPAPEIKVLGATEQIKEEVIEVEVAVQEAEKEPEDEEVNVEDITPAADEQSVPTPLDSIPPPPELPAAPEEAPALEEKPLCEDTPPRVASHPPLVADPPLPPEPEAPPETTVEPPVPTAAEPATDPEADTDATTDPVDETVLEDKNKKDDDAEDSIPLKEMVREETAAETEAEPEVKAEPRPETEETHTETDDDTPMELSREEEKDGKKKRDYSRKKKPDSRTCSGSESAPESPGGAASEADRQHRLWKKSVMLVYSRLCAHKYASIFLRAISDDEAPGYSIVVKKPMDLTTIRRNIDAGVIRTTAEFQRDILLMLSNALMYNSSEHSVYLMAKEMFAEAVGQLGILVAAQAHAGLVALPPSPAPSPARRKRRRLDQPALLAKRPPAPL